MNIRQVNTLPCLLACALLVSCSKAPTPSTPDAGPALEDHVRFLAGIEPARNSAHPESLLKAAVYIEGQLRGAGGEIRLHDYQVEGAGYRNVSAFFGPESGDMLVVGAHYDVCGDVPGADDNASGVATLLALGKRLGERAPLSRVELVAFTLEEPPHFRSVNMGSAHHARSLSEAGVTLRGMICLEMVGYYSDDEDSQTYPVAVLKMLFPSTGNFLAIVGRWEDVGLVREIHASMEGASDLPVVQLASPIEIPGLDWSDHRSYWAEGFSGVMLTDTAFMRNANYHEASDTPDTLDFERMAQVVVGLEAAVRDLCLREAD